MVRLYIETSFSAELGDDSSRAILLMWDAARPADLLFFSTLVCFSIVFLQQTRECDQM